MNCFEKPLKTVTPLATVRAKFGNGKVFFDEVKINSLVTKWHLMHPLLIALPNSSKFQPVMLVEQYKKKAFSSNRTKSTFAIFYSIFASLFFIGIYFLNSNEKTLNLSLVGLVMSFYFLIEHFLVSNNVNRTTNRSILVTNVFLHSKKYFLLWFFVCLMMGGSQLALNFVFQDVETVIYRYGGIYEYIDNGEWWRLFTASIFHSGITHWVVNLVLILLVAPLYAISVGNNGIIVFIIGCVTGSISSYLSYLMGFSFAEAYVGISAGIYALIGYVALYSYLNEKNKSNGLCFSLVNFIFMSVIISKILVPSISNTAHLSGFILGAALVIFQVNKSK